MLPAENLRRHLGEGNAGRFLQGVDRGIRLVDLAGGTCLGGRLAELAGSSVLLMARDQLDAAIADGIPVGVYHEVIALTDMPDDLASCGGIVPPSGVVEQWMHYGPLVVYGTSAGSSAAADATLTVPAGSAARPGGTVAVTLYFARAGSLVLRLPVSG